MSEYAKLAHQLGKVRRSWKRAAVLSGLAMVLLESVGIFTLVILLTVLYGGSQNAAVRIGLSAAGVLAVAVLTVRHIVLPLLRRIPDEQVALYVEERDDEFNGSLITAAEFGRSAGATPLQGRMIEAVVSAADRRAEGARLGALVSWARLRKYGLAAVALIVSYLAICAAFPDTVGRHVALAIQPWRADALPGQPPPGMTLDEARRLLPVEFRLSKGDVRIPRGSDFELEAQLSRSPDAPVLLHFRPVVEAGPSPGVPAWQQVPMREIEKLHGYARTLESISESMEYHVSAGPYNSPAHRITVYDKIELRGVETTVRYPKYLELPDKVEALSSGDVSAPVGSSVTVRILVNTELASGKVVWEGNQDQPLTVDPDRRLSASFAFEVSQNRRYSFEVTDIDGQVAKSLGPSEVFALKDNPPTLELVQPTGPLETHPLGEVNFVAKATDDFGVAQVDLVYLRFSAKGTTEGQIPLLLRRQGGREVPLPDAVEASLRLMMEEIKPPFEAGEVISWYIEARDRKADNPPAASDLFLIAILPFEPWGAYEFAPSEPPEPMGDQPPALADILMQTWQLHREKPTLDAATFNTRCDGIAQSLLNPATGEIWDFIDTRKYPHLRPLAERVKKLAGLAHKALKEHDTAEAVRWLRIAVADMLAAGITATEMLIKEGPQPEGAAAATGGGARPPDQQARLLEVFAAVKAELEKMMGSKVESGLGNAEAAAEAGQAVQGIRSQQQGVINQAKEQARGAPTGAAGGAGGDGPPGDPQVQSPKLAALRQAQGGLADRARSVAGKLRQADSAAGGPARSAGGLQGAADTLDKASSAMRTAAGQFGGGNLPGGITAATEADKLLGEAAGRLVELRQGELEAVLAEAERMVEAILQEQSAIRQETDTIRKDPQTDADGQPGAKQKRELKKLSFRQAELKARFDVFEGKMETLQKWAENTARTETARFVQEAYRTTKRTQPGQKMANAVVELGGFKPDAAVKEEVEAEQGLAKILKDLQAASDTLAATREEALKRALREAKAIEKGITKIAATQPGEGQAGGEGAQAGKVGDQAGKAGGQQGGEGAQAGKAGGQQDGEGAQAGKAGGQQGGEGAQAGKAGGQQGGEGAQAGKAGSQQGGEGAQAGGAGGGGAQLTPGQRRDISKAIASDLRRLDRQVQDRDYGLGADAEAIKRVAGDPSLDGRLIADPKAQAALLTMIRRVSDKLEAELESTAKAKRLFSAQREECPPQYRRLVNKYYEALSQRQR